MDLLKRDYNIDVNKCTSDIMKNKFNDLTTSYYLISKRKERAGIFRQQYKDELKNMMMGKKTKAAAAKANNEEDNKAGAAKPAPITETPIATIK